MWTVHLDIQPVSLSLYRESIYLVRAIAETDAAYAFTIRQQDHGTRTRPLYIERAQYKCWDSDRRPCWWLETGPGGTARHFQKREHEYLRVPHVDVQVLTSIDMLEVFRIFCDTDRTLDELTETDLRARSWQRFPQT